MGCDSDSRNKTGDSTPLLVNFYNSPYKNRVLYLILYLKQYLYNALYMKPI